MTDFIQARKNMVDGQIHPSGVIDLSILNSFSATPREVFVPASLKNVAYNDDEIRIDKNTNMLSPTVHARLIQAVLPNKDDVVLDLCVGTGYSSAILSPIVTTIISMDNDQKKLDKATRLWSDLGACNIVSIDGNPNLGAGDHAPFSLIIINGAVEDVPKDLLSQLSVGGRLIAIIKKQGGSIGHATLFNKSDAGNITSRIVFDCNATLLKAFLKEKEFVF